MPPSSHASTSSHASIPSVFRPRGSGGSTPLRSRPLSLAELADISNSPEQAAALIVSPEVPLRRYIAGAESLRRQAETHRNEGRRESEFLCLAKCAKLLLEVLPKKHPGYKNLDKATRDNLRKEAQAVLDQLGSLKSELNDRFEAWRAANPDAPLDLPTKSPAPAGPRPAPVPSTHSMLQPTPSGSTSGSSRNSPSPQPKDKSGADDSITFVKPNRSMGFDVREILGGGGGGTRSASAGGSGRWQDTDSATSPSNSLTRGGGFTTSPLLPFSHSHGRASTASNSHHGGTERGSQSFTYPTLRPTASIRMTGDQRDQGFAPSSHRTARYYQTIAEHLSQGVTSAPPGSKREKLARKGEELAISADQKLASATSRLGISNYPTVQGTLRKLGHGDVEKEATDLVGQEVPIEAFTESGQPLRKVIFPSSIISRFLAVAEPNTSASLETCAFLLGRLERGGSMLCTHMVFPRQIAKTDRCDTTDEEMLWEYAAKEDLIMLAWIHSHPAFSCFLSSRDLHCHAPIQAMLPEAVAIVVAPNSEPSVGIFRLTAPPGLETILRCTDPSAFHQHLSPHSDRPLALYTDAASGHVELDPRRRLVVADLR